MISKQDTKLFEKYIIMNWFYQLICLVEAKHSRNQPHGNIKPSNIFFDNQNEIVLSELELKLMVNKPTDSPYLAPEMIGMYIKYFHKNDKADIWEIGAILFNYLI